MNMTLGKRITLGFTIVLLIAAILGGIGVVNMNTAKDNSYDLAKKYVPEVNYLVRLERNISFMMYEMRAYNFNGNPKFLESGRKAYERALARLEDSKKLFQDYPELQKLGQAIAVVDKNLKEYGTLIDQTEAAILRTEQIMESMNTAASQFMTNSGDYVQAVTEVTYEDIRSNLNIDLMNQRVEMLALANDVIDAGNAVRIANFRAQATGDYGSLTSAMSNFETIETLTEKLYSVTRFEINQKRLRSIQESARAYKKAIDDMLTIQKTIAQINQGRITTGSAATDATEEVVRYAVEVVVEMSEQAESQLETAASIMITGLIIAILLGIAIAAFITITTNRAITAAVRSILEANDQVVSASNEIADSSTSLAEGASRQASSVEEVSATVEESTSINTQNAENTREADILAKETKAAAQKGYSKGDELMKAMESINHSSERISKIIKTIDEIASQTKLLALNAAVEAARAGEHGLGFAVVADEVKSLAQRSADAATETATIIEEAIVQAKNGSSISKETSEAFEDILQKIEKTSNLISEVSISAKEQSEGMNQIATAMGEIDQITQQNAATSEEAAAASEELNAQAHAMKETVGIIAKMVGFVQEHINNTQSAPKAKKALSKPKAKLAHKAPAQNKKRNNDEDVFPLDEDDLKEF